MGTTGTNDIPRLPGNNNFKVLEAGARKLGYKEVHTGNMAINSAAARRPQRLPADRLLLPGLQVRRASGRRCTPRSRRARRPAISRCGPTAMALRIEHDAQGKVTGVVYCRRRRQAAAAEGARRGGRRQFDRKPAPAAELRVVANFPTAWRTARVRSGATTCATPPAASMRCSTSRCTCIAAPRWPASCATKRATIRSAASSAATSWRHCRSDCRSWRPSSIPGAWGRSFTSAIDDYANMAGMWIVGEDMPRETNRVTLDPKVKDQCGMPVADVHFDDHENDDADARTTPTGRVPRSTTRSARCAPSRRRPIRRTHNLGTNRMSANAARRRRQQVRPDARHQEPVRLRRQPVHHRRRGKPDVDHRGAGDQAGGVHRRSDEAKRYLRTSES